ncbi:MAG: hypothetical protein HRT88_18335 [Lentisphaeraceae bacterium]|nr:hypothetical protein [Lentisphaeraceae bacterium]
MNRREILMLNFHHEKIKHQRYCYRVKRTIVLFWPVTGYDIRHRYFRLFPDGKLEIYDGYYWDGATGSPDFASIMRWSLSHDVFYQCLRELLFFGAGEFSWPEHERLRQLIDGSIDDIAKLDGMWKPMRKMVYMGVRTAMARRAARPEMDFLISECLKLRI